MITYSLFPSHLSEQIFSKDVDKRSVALLAARASRIENQDAIDAAVVGMLADPKEVKLLATKIVVLQSIHLAINVP